MLLSLSLALRFVTLGLPKQEMMPPECPEIGPKLVGQGENTLSENISVGCFEKGLGAWPLSSWGSLSITLQPSTSVLRQRMPAPSFPVSPLLLWLLSAEEVSSPTPGVPIQHVFSMYLDQHITPIT